MGEAEGEAGGGAAAAGGAEGEAMVVASEEEAAFLVGDGIGEIATESVPSEEALERVRALLRSEEEEVGSDDDDDGLAWI